MKDFAAAYKDQAIFLVIYVREAHPAFEKQTAQDAGWKAIDGVVFHQPKTYAERRKLAEKACSSWELGFPSLVDTMEPSAGKLYLAWPNRIYVIGEDGKIAYHGPKGPGGVRPHDGEKALRKLLDLPEGKFVTPEDKGRGSSGGSRGGRPSPGGRRPPRR